MLCVPMPYRQTEYWYKVAKTGREPSREQLASSRISASIHAVKMTWQEIQLKVVALHYISEFCSDIFGNGDTYGIGG